VKQVNTLKLVLSVWHDEQATPACLPEVIGKYV
jgi:hypothetical protein